ncbi:putative N6-adenine-specific DNA methylase [Nitrosomonas sp. Nm51]|uniref:THUMP domain-containing class I SAM-dependent RNA methyltransferase n=1 Tax=Nitrosomonas sp. Nm51 TaxID=133720 RepID=UPI0008D55477|nr:THUMP domain-containing protein [Nitrosomonas sp. Nm51]SER04281.1 putative N6-adenine-specific DNA methylase [Nitrosomonas sp. Nm51]
MNEQILQFFAPCPRGLESALAVELSALGADAVQPANSGVHFQGNWKTCYQTNLGSRIASRILWQATKIPYRSEQDIYNTTLGLPWHDWFSHKLTIRVNLAAIKCPLRSLDFVTLKIKDAVCDKFRKITGKRPSIDTVHPDIRIHGFLDAGEFTLYLDTSGDALFKRGYRKAAGNAPLRENLAAGILYLTGWQPDTPLLDPMCGSGTLLIEAAQIALNIAPGSLRHFAFEKFKQFDRTLWNKLKEKALTGQRPVIRQSIYGSDLYGYALSDARINLEAAGLRDAVHLKQANILEISAPAPQGVLVTNPPYGVRIGESDSLTAFYPQLGNVLKNKFNGWYAYILSADSTLPKTIRLKATRRMPLFNGALECRLFEYKMVTGNMRTQK